MKRFSIKFMQRKGIQGKITLYMVVLILCSSLVGWGGVYSYVTGLMLQNEMTRYEEIIDSHLNQISARLLSVEEYGRIISYSTDVQQNLASCVNQSGYWQFAAVRDLDQRMRNYVILRPEYITNIYVASPGLETAFSTDYSPDLQGLKRVLQGVETQFTPIRLQETYSPYQAREVLSYFQPVYSLGDNSRLLGYLVINMEPEQLFADAYQEYAAVEGFYLTDHRQNILYTYGEKDLAFAEQRQYNSQGIAEMGEHYNIQREIPELRLCLNVSITKEGIQSVVSKTGNVLMGIMAAGLLVAVALSAVLGRGLVRPIVRLTNHMKIVAAGDFLPMAEPEGEDEIAQMTRIFNRMIAQIRHLMGQNREAAQQQKQLTMKLFLSKINPHFIYNTLNCTIYLARKNRTEEIISMTTALIRILRKNVTLDERNVTVQEEMDYLRDYVAILQYRYQHRIELDFLISRKFYGLKLPPLILYPMVENSIFHGINAKDEDGHVVVALRETALGMEFSVEDDGVGIAGEKLEYMRRYLQDPSIYETSGNIGLRNVNDRLKLCYGKAGELNLQSVPGRGTRVSFTIPTQFL